MRQKIMYDTRILEAAKEHEAPLKFFESPPKEAGPLEEIGGLVLDAVGVLLKHIEPFDGDFRSTVASADLDEARLLVKNAEGVVMFESPLEVIGTKGQLFLIESQELDAFSVELAFGGVYHSKFTMKLRVYLSCLLPD